MLIDTSEDTHLQSMQSLAAHLKLLLDSPEHLWRLMEKKMYLHAAWLFLLSRVVHRSLLRHEADEDDEGWTALGIDITVSSVNIRDFDVRYLLWSSTGAISSRTTTVGGDLAVPLSDYS